MGDEIKDKEVEKKDPGPSADIPTPAPKAEEISNSKESTPAPGPAAVTPVLEMKEELKVERSGGKDLPPPRKTADVPEEDHGKPSKGCSCDILRILVLGAMLAIQVLILDGLGHSKLDEYWRLTVAGLIVAGFCALGALFEIVRQCPELSAEKSRCLQLQWPTRIGALFSVLAIQVSITLFAHLSTLSGDWKNGIAWITAAVLWIATAAWQLSSRIPTTAEKTALKFPKERWPVRIVVLPIPPSTRA